MIGADCYLEDSDVSGGSRNGRGSVLSHVTVCAREVPEDVVLHGLKLLDGRFVVRIYGVNDNPKGDKDPPFLNTTMSAFAKCCGAELWDGYDPTLWQARIYQVCDTIRDAVDAALNVYAIAQ